jgi:NAD(P)-dependent dehydrogenase (short-subunit alcohol dehydrogenase family)
MAWVVIILILLYVLKRFFNGPKTPFSKDMTGKVAVITGCSAGIGKETAIDLLKKGAKVIFACRDEEKTLRAINEISDASMRDNAVFMKLDLCNFDSINEFVDNFKSKFLSFDVLVNNAGGIFDDFKIKNGIEQTILTNHIGNVILSARMIHIISNEGLIINLSSMASFRISPAQFESLIKVIDFSNYGGSYQPWLSYSFSKLANVIHAIHLDEFAIKKGINIKTASVHPGVVRSEFFSRGTTFLYKIVNFLIFPIKYIFFKDSKMGAEPTLHVIYMNYDKLNSGAYFSECVESKKNVIADHPENIKKFMEYTKSLISINVVNIPPELIEYLDF